MSAPKIPYPPSPTNVPDDLTDFPESYIRQQNKLLAGIFVFLIFYIAMVIFFAMVAVWCVITLEKWLVVKIILLVLSATFFLYLVKGFFKRHPMDKEMHIEITEEEQPILFGFIHQICEELGAPEPNKVFVSPDVNAAVMPRTSLINLFVEPKKDLLIGLGLVNCMNLSEFKSVMAHEFGHFSQSAMAGSYTYVAHRIIVDLVDGEDWFDRFINWCKKQENVFSIFGHGVGGCLWVGRKILWAMYKAITLQRLAVMRESEFHADLLAVKAAGSDAVALSLFHLRFGNLCLQQAVSDLATALDHKLYSNDIFLHQERSEAVVRRKRKDPNLGIAPPHDHPLAGKSIQIFDPDDEKLADDIPEMRRTHPPAHELEESAKRVYIPAVVDHRSPWLLFTDAAELRERMSYKFYRMVFRVPKNTELTDAQKVQAYIDNEHAETTYDPKYHGVYDDRPLEPGDIDELNTQITDSPWSDDRIEKVYSKLFEGCKEHAEEHADLHKELASLNSNVVGKPSPKIKRMIEDVEKKLDTNWEWFKSFDRRVYLVHVQMAGQVNVALRDELVERYRFQMEVQRFFQEARKNFNKSNDYIEAYHAAVRGEIQVPNDFGAEVIAVLRAAWKSLKNIIQDARKINLPAMKNFEEGERLADFILEGKMVPEPPLSELKGAWVHKLMVQLQGVKNRCFRLHFKSVGGILAIQEKVAAQWMSNRAPVAAEVLEPEPLPAEVVVEPLPLDDVIPAEVIAAEVIADDVIAAEVVEIVEPLPVEEPIPAVVVEDLPVVEPLPEPVLAPAPVAATIIEDVPDVPVVEEPQPASEVMFSFDPEPTAQPKQEPDPGSPFSFDSQPASKPAEPTTSAFSFESPFSFDSTPATKPEPAKPEPAVAEVDAAFRLDAEPAKPAAPPTTHTPTVAARAPESPVGEEFNLNAPEIFSLDPDAPAAAPASQPSPSSNPAPAVEETFSLDAEEHEVRAPYQEATASPLPGATANPPVRPLPTSASPPNGTAPRSTLVPAKAKRPAVRITFVKPGEKSPFGQ